MGWLKVSGFFANSLPARLIFSQLLRSEFLFSKKSFQIACNAEIAIFLMKFFVPEKY